MRRLLMLVCAFAVGGSTARAQSFDAALHGQLRGQRGNLVYSPASVRIALTMAMAGARGATEAELAQALQLPAGAETARKVGKLVEAWDHFDPDKVVFRVRDRVWVQRGSKLADDYVRTLRDELHAPLGVVDFAGDSGGARDAINRWVAEATENMIPSLLGPGQPKPTVKLALTNAVYFKGKWAAPFYAADTRNEIFFADGKRKTVTPTMHSAGEEPVARVDGALVLEKSYGGGDRIVMDIILPDKRDGLRAIEDAYVKGALPAWLTKLERHPVDVALPKVTMSSAFDLAWALRGLGLVRATSDHDADFSGIDGARDLFIDDVVQKAIVELDEEGAKAAAATYVGIAVTAAEPSPPPRERITFIADHPFLFVIRDASTGWVPFAGRVVDPTAR